MRAASRLLTLLPVVVVGTGVVVGTIVVVTGEAVVVEGAVVVVERPCCCSWCCKRTDPTLCMRRQQCNRISQKQFSPVVSESSCMRAETACVLLAGYFDALTSGGGGDWRRGWNHCGCDRGSCCCRGCRGGGRRPCCCSWCCKRTDPTLCMRRQQCNRCKLTKAVQSSGF